jgi:hypothetical protein
MTALDVGRINNEPVLIPSSANKCSTNTIIVPLLIHERACYELTESIAVLSLLLGEYVV